MAVLPDTAVPLEVMTTTCALKPETNKTQIGKVVLFTSTKTTTGGILVCLATFSHTVDNVLVVFTS